MPDHTWWTRPARDEEQGSFCDTTSEITYHNESKEEAVESKQEAIRRGDDVVEAAFEVEDYGSRVRHNSNRSAIDNEGFEYDEKLAPGN